ncbi:MAG: hypothetical protein HY533_00315, partial [Chloroflexi bacterium]|nr:hypothetical protein [Chloroflexota bacterium]
MKDREATAMRPRLLSALLLSGGALLLSASPAYAHGFGQRYDLPVPLWLYLTGAGAAVALSFLVIALFAQGRPSARGYPTFNLLRPSAEGLRLRPLRLFVHPLLLGLARLAAVLLFLLTVAAGLLGDQDPLENLAPTMVWVVWWVGLAYVSALVGNVWALLNPWNTLFSWADALYRRLNPGDQLSSQRPYPERLGYWPAVVLFGLFAWVEIVFPRSAEPRSLATLAALYTFVTFAGMVAFGKHAWLKHGEAFSVVFGLLARFAPTEVRVKDPGICNGCSAGCDPEACVNCYECWGKATPTGRGLNLRPFGAGLLSREAASPSLLTMVLLTLSTVTFDGFTSTPLWADLLGTLFPAFVFLGSQAAPAIRTVGLLLFPLLFLAVYLSFSVLMAAASRRGEAWPAFARAFVFSLIPIALAYHLAHFLGFLLIQGQLLIPLASDPFGWGWDLLGTASYSVNIAIVNARFAWFTAVIAIVLGHITAVYVAHVVAMRTLGERRAAQRSQYPMLALMVGYTMVSLW